LAKGVFLRAALERPSGPIKKKGGIVIADQRVAARHARSASYFLFARSVIV
jgi:hypothetical protein